LVGLLAALVIVVGILWDPLTRTADRAAESFRKSQQVVTERRS
jgi:hypothetical protein